MRVSGAIVGVTCALLMGGGVGCSAPDDDAQRLVASGQLFDEDGQPAPSDTRISRYDLTFIVAGETGEVALTRTFTDDGAGDAIVTDVDGRFGVTSEDLHLVYDWYRDELVCDDVCVAWETVCEQVTEEVCYDTCYEDVCWEECDTECWEEVVCDEFGDCWTETICEDYCSEVCETTSYACDCQLETYESCGDQCVETVEECGWVTRTYTSHAELEDVLRTEASIWKGDLRVDGETLEAHQHRGCTGGDTSGKTGGNCVSKNLWIQKDRFALPQIE